MYERSFTVVQQVGEASKIVPFRTLLPDGSRKYKISAWFSGPPYDGGTNTSPPVLLFRGSPPLAEAVSRVTQQGDSQVDCLLCVPFAVGETAFDGDGTVSVYFAAPNNSGAPFFCTVRIREV